MHDLLRRDRRFVEHPIEIRPSLGSLQNVLRERDPREIGEQKLILQNLWGFGKFRAAVHIAHKQCGVKIAKVRSHSLNKFVRHVVCNDTATLVWLADMACLEINQFLSSAPRTDWHEMVLVDLDPYPPAEFEDAVQIARAVHSALVEMHLRHMIKTSGADGFHFLIPVVPKYSIENIRRFVLLLGILLEDLAPNGVSTSRNRTDRIGKVYVDFFQNGLQKTVAAPFTLRPEPGAPVSFPLDPKRLNFRFRPSDFNIRTVPEILKREGVPEFDPRPDQLLEPAFAEMGVKL